LNESTYGTGQQQRAMVTPFFTSFSYLPHLPSLSLTPKQNLYAESTFVCPSYWLAEAFSGNARKAYKYQYSVIGASHGQDLGAYTGVYPGPFLGPDFVKAFESTYPSSPPP
jgi:hypothetical protein